MILQRNRLLAIIELDAVNLEGRRHHISLSLPRCRALFSSMVTFGDARACGKIGCGRSPRSVFLGAVSPFLSLIRGADGGAAHCCREHEGPTLFIPVRFLRATAWL